jgi:hypothetical protein
MTSLRPTNREVRDQGFSLTEIVIAVALTGTIVLAIMTAVFTGVRASSTSRSAAKVETAIVNAADRVNRAPKKCDYTIYAQAAVQTEGWDPSRAAVVQEYFVPGADAMSAGEWRTGAAGSPGCPGPTPTDLLVQRVTITITSPDGSVRRNITVVKSDV